MNKLLVASIAIAGLFGTSALAADFPVKAPAFNPPLAAPPYNWSGPYLGANFGGGWTAGSLSIAGNTFTGAFTEFLGGTQISIPGSSFSGGITEFIGGVQGGYNFQASHFLVGVEGDFDGASFSHSSLPGATLGSVNQHWISTVAGRFGWVDDRWLVFGKLGGGWEQSSATLNIPGASWSGSNISGGWLFGGGIEYGFKPNWTVKLEYDYLTLANWSSTTVPTVALDRDVQMVKAGINYKFQSGVAEGAQPSSTDGSAAEPSGNLAKQSQNPIADLVSVPFQSNTNFSTGPFNRPQEVLNIQPVIPMHLNADWNLISRTIVPLISQPDPVFDSNINGIGDITQSLFLSPTNPGALIWGVGPVFTVPSASDAILGTGKVLAGPTAVFLTTPGNWVLGVLLNNQWSVGGNTLRPPVNTFLGQPFVNYNMPHGWFLTTAPVITSNWLAASGQQWTLPIGGGFGRVFKLGGQPVSASISGYYNAINPAGAPDWQLRAQLSLLFPGK